MLPRRSKKYLRVKLEENATYLSEKIYFYLKITIQTSQKPKAMPNSSKARFQQQSSVFNNTNKTKRKQQKLVSKQSLITMKKNELVNKETIYQPDEVQIQEEWDQQIFDSESSSKHFSQEKNSINKSEGSSCNEDTCIEKIYCSHSNVKCIKYKEQYIYYFTTSTTLTDEEIQKLFQQLKQKETENQHQSENENYKLPEKPTSQTKNLPSFFLRQFFKVINQNKHQLNEEELKLFIKYETSGIVSQANIAKLREFISVSTFNKLIHQYLLSFNYLNDILSSDKIADVQVHILYLPKMLEAVKNPQDFFSWKD